VVADGPPRVTGHSTYRAVIPTGQMPEDLRWNAATLWAGPKCHIVHYSLSGWKSFNLVVTYYNQTPEPVAGRPVSDDEVLAGFQHVHPRARDIIRRGRDWKLWVLCDRDPVERWADGHVALLGDAAHPTLQYLAQGACMAMEDAVCVSHAMAAQRGDPASALERYQHQRVLRTARVQLLSRAIGDHVYHPAGAHAGLRNAIMSAKTTAEWHGSLAWLYGLALWRHRARPDHDGGDRHRRLTHPITSCGGAPARTSSRSNVHTVLGCATPGPAGRDLLNERIAHPGVDVAIVMAHRSTIRRQRRVVGALGDPVDGFLADDKGRGDDHEVLWSMSTAASVACDDFCSATNPGVA
jgi:hypothetical protein